MTMLTVHFFRLQLICVPASPSSVLPLSQIMRSYLSFIYHDKAVAAPVHPPLLPADFINVMRNLWPKIRYAGGERGTEVFCIGLALRTERRQITSGPDAEVENTRSPKTGPAAVSTRGGNVGEAAIATSSAAVSTTTAQPVEPITTPVGASSQDVRVPPSQGYVSLSDQLQQKSRGGPGELKVSSSDVGHGGTKDTGPSGERSE